MSENQTAGSANFAGSFVKGAWFNPGHDEFYHHFEYQRFKITSPGD